jgi:2'-5' RNA ligase
MAIFKLCENKVKNMLRLFVAIWIPDNIKNKIEKLQEKMSKLPMKAKFVEPGNLHITITFLGNIEDNKLNDLINKLDKLTKNIGKFMIRLENMKLIPSENYIRVMGIEVKNNQVLAETIKCLGMNLNGKYHKNVKLTLCRIKNISDKKVIKNFIEKNRNIKIGEFEVESVALVKSTLTSRGPVYKTLHESLG